MMRGKFDIGEWQPWFAWRPVRLFGSFRFAWLRAVSRRHVLTDRLETDYSDTPGEHPPGYGRRKHAAPSKIHRV